MCVCGWRRHIPDGSRELCGSEVSDGVQHHTGVIVRASSRHKGCEVGSGRREVPWGRVIGEVPPSLSVGHPFNTSERRGRCAWRVPWPDLSLSSLLRVARAWSSRTRRLAFTAHHTLYAPSAATSPHTANRERSRRSIVQTVGRGITKFKVMATRRCHMSRLSSRDRPNFSL